MVSLVMNILLIFAHRAISDQQQAKEVLFLDFLRILFENESRVKTFLRLSYLLRRQKFVEKRSELFPSEQYLLALRYLKEHLTRILLFSSLMSGIMAS